MYRESHTMNCYFQFGCYYKESETCHFVHLEGIVSENTNKLSKTRSLFVRKNSQNCTKRRILLKL